MKRVISYYNITMLNVQASTKMASKHAKQKIRRTTREITSPQSQQEFLIYLYKKIFSDTDLNNTIKEMT